MKDNEIVPTKKFKKASSVQKSWLFAIWFYVERKCHSSPTTMLCMWH